MSLGKTIWTVLTTDIGQFCADRRERREAEEMQQQLAAIREKATAHISNPHMTHFQAVSSDYLVIPGTPSEIEVISLSQLVEVAWADKVSFPQFAEEFILRHNDDPTKVQMTEGALKELMFLSALAIRQFGGKTKSAQHDPWGRDVSSRQFRKQQA